MLLSEEKMSYTWTSSNPSSEVHHGKGYGCGACCDVVLGGTSRACRVYERLLPAALSAAAMSAKNIGNEDGAVHENRNGRRGAALHSHGSCTESRVQNAKRHA